MKALAVRGRCGRFVVWLQADVALGPALPANHQPLKTASIRFRHPPRSEPPLEGGADAAPVERGNALDRIHRFGFAIDNEAGHAVLDDFGNGSAAPSNDRGAAGHRLDHHQAERLGPIDRDQHRHGIAEKVLLLTLIDLADKLNLIAVQERFDLLLEIVSLHPRYFCRDAQREISRSRQLDRDMRSFFWREAAQKRQIASGLQIRQQQPLGKTVINGVDIIQVRQRASLAVRDRYKRRIGKAGDKRMHMWKIEPSVQRGDKWAAEPAKQRNMDPIQVAMNDVEFVGAARNAFEQGSERRSWIDRRAAQP